MHMCVYKKNEIQFFEYIHTCLQMFHARSKATHSQRPKQTV